MVYLIKTQEVYRVDDEAAAKQLIEEAKADGCGEVMKYSCVYKEKTAKGEVVDSWYLVTLNRQFTKEKEPEGFASVSYEV